MTHPNSRSAKIYRRNNGSYGASCDGCLDTGYDIRAHLKDGSKFTVFDHDDNPLAVGVSKADAEKAITIDWRKPT